MPSEIQLMVLAAFILFYFRFAVVCTSEKINEKGIACVNFI